MPCCCDSLPSVPTSHLTLEEASAVLVSLLSGHTPASLEEIRGIAEESGAPWLLGSPG